MTIKANTDVLFLFSQQLKAAQPAVYDTMQKALKQAGEKIADKAAENADWSHKIPRTLRWTSSNVKVTVRAGYKTVKIARWFEQGHTNLNPRSWRHPVFPHGPRKNWHWTAQREPLRPFLAPALNEVAPQITEATVQALADAINDVLDLVTADSDAIMAEAG